MDHGCKSWSNLICKERTNYWDQWDGVKKKEIRANIPNLVESKRKKKNSRVRMPKTRR